MKIKMVLGALVCSAMLGTAAHAQSSGDDADPVSGGSSIVLTLKDAEDKFGKSMTEINDILAKTRKDINEAGPLFDKMIQAIEEQAKMGDPNGDFVKNLEAYIADVNALADEAETAGDTETAEALRKTAGGFESARDRTIKLHSESFRLIRSIKADKRKYVIRKQAKLADAALKVAEEGVKRLEAVYTEIQTIRSEVPEDDGAVAQ